MSEDERSRLFDVIYKQDYKKIVGYIHNKFYYIDSAGVDDLIQEVFLQIWNGLPSLKEPQFIHSWAFRVMYNRLMNEYRAVACMKEFPLNNVTFSEDAKNIEEEMANIYQEANKFKERTPEQDVSLNLFMKHLDFSIGRLKPKQRNVVRSYLLNVSTKHSNKALSGPDRRTKVVAMDKLRFFLRTKKELLSAAA